jgi:hypothetical protein
MKALADGSLKQPIVEEGMAKQDDKDPNIILLSNGISGDQWVKLPLHLIERVDYIQNNYSGTLQYPWIRVFLKEPPPSNVHAHTLATLLRLSRAQNVQRGKLALAGNGGDDHGPGSFPFPLHPPPPPSPPPAHWNSDGIPNVGLLSNHNTWVSAQPDGSITVDRKVPLGWEMFEVQTAPDNARVSIRSTQFNTYLSAQSDGSVRCDRHQVQGWETWLPVCNGTLVGFQSAHGKYLSAQSDGTLVANRDSVQGWEQFSPYEVQISPNPSANVPPGWSTLAIAGVGRYILNKIKLGMCLHYAITHIGVGINMGSRLLASIPTIPRDLETLIGTIPHDSQSLEREEGDIVDIQAERGVGATRGR